MWHVWGRRGFWYENLNERGHLQDLVAEGRIILLCNLKKVWESVEWIYLAHYSKKWQAVVNPVMNLWVP
jgi:hypothetical protein